VGEGGRTEGWGERAAGALDPCVPYSRRARAVHSGGAQKDGRARQVEKQKIPAKRKRSVQRGADAGCAATPSSPLPGATVEPRDTTMRTHGQGANRAARTKNPLTTAGRVQPLPAHDHAQLFSAIPSGSVSEQPSSGLVCISTAQLRSSTPSSSSKTFEYGLLPRNHTLNAQSSSSTGLY